MSRSMRSRQPLLKYPEDEYITGTKSKKPKAQKSNASDVATENSSQPNKAIVAGSRSRLVKGNLHTGQRTVQSILSPVLQDRTNLPHEPLKVDLSVKKGTDDTGTMKKSAKSTRKPAKSATSEENEDEIMKKTSSGAEMRKKFHKVGNERISSPGSQDSLKDLNENEKLVDSDAASSAGNRIRKRAMPKKISPKTVVESENNFSSQDIVKNDEAQESETESCPNGIRTRFGKRGGLKKILSKKSDAYEKNSSLRAIVKNDEAAESKAETRYTGIGTRVGKHGRSKKILSKKSDGSEKNPSLRDIAENDAVIESKAEKRSNGIGRRVDKRGVTKKILSKKSDDVKKKSLLEDIPQNDETAVSMAETRSNTMSTRVGKRGMLKKTSLPKKSIDNVENEKKSYPRPSKVIDKNAATANSPLIKKFFKSKPMADGESINSPIKKTVIAKRRNIGGHSKARMSTSFRLRQTTLSESFAKQSAKKLLRPRQAARNYCEDSVISDKQASADEATKKSGPIYRTAKLQDNSDNDKNEIYEFQFDSNDSREKKPKKTRKRIVRKNVLTRKAKPTGSAPKKMTSSEMRATTKTTQIMEKINDKPHVIDPVSSELNEPTCPREMEFEAPPSDAMETDDVPVISKNDSIAPAIEKEVPHNFGTSPAKPIVVQSIELRGNERINLTSTPQLVKSHGTNARAENSVRSSLQYRTMMNHALLTKSLSPINRAIENFDPGSPWRPPTFVNQQFSRVNNVVQSTPQVRKFAEMLEKASVQPKSRNTKITTGNEIVANDPQVLDRTSPKKAFGLAKSPRKFGTEISNVNKHHAMGMRVIDEINDDNSRENRTLPKKSAIPSTSQDAISIGQEQGGNSFEDEIDDKENCTPSPKKSPLKGLPKSPLKSPSKSPLKSLSKSPLRSPQKLVSKLKPSRPLSTISSLPKENVEPQAGPSNVQKPPLDDSRIFKQSNLDNFLNLDEMPKSTRITTIHGIFDDAHSTPISGKPIRKIMKEANVQNAFGFDEFDELDESSMDISPIKKSIAIFQNPKNVALTNEQKVQEVKAKEVKANEVKAKEAKAKEIKAKDAAPSRLSVGDIKKHLLPIAKKSNVNEAPIVERTEIEENENADNREKGTIPKNQMIPDPVTFSDTFDVMENQSESSSTKVPEVRLFEDIEPPAHFKQAPRYSYKRKRPVGIIFSENEEENESPAVPENRGTKKRKISKVERERQKQMENWAKDLNNTFEEIDHFDLVVE